MIGLRLIAIRFGPAGKSLAQRPRLATVAGYGRGFTGPGMATRERVFSNLPLPPQPWKLK